MGYHSELNYSSLLVHKYINIFSQTSGSVPNKTEDVLYFQACLPLVAMSCAKKHVYMQNYWDANQAEDYC